MADGSPEDRTGPKQINDITFSAPDSLLCDTKKCSGETIDGDRLKLSFYTELETSESCEKSDTHGVATKHSAAVVCTNSRNSREAITEEREDRKKRCFDRYDSSESSDSGVAVLSPTESGGCSGSDITEPASPRSPESSGSTEEEGAGARMPPWASDPAPPAPRRLAAQPAPVRRPHLPIHRRITEYFNHKMKPQNGLKRDSSCSGNNDTKRKCLPKNDATHDLEKYISYISQTLSPKILLDVGKQTDAAKRSEHPTSNGVIDTGKPTDLSKVTSSSNFNGTVEFIRSNDSKDKNGINSFGLVGLLPATDTHSKEKHVNGIINGLMDAKKKAQDIKMTKDSSANTVVNMKVQNVSMNMNKKQKVPISTSSDINGLRIAPATSASQSPKKLGISKQDSRVNGVVSSTTKLDSKMNGVICGSNNLSLLSSKCSQTKKEPTKRSNQPSKRTNRKSSACIANSKNLTWSKANNLKQVQLQQQNCVNTTKHKSPSMTTIPVEANSAPKMNIPNGVRQVSMTMNNSLGNLNVPMTNLQNCHQLNIPQPCNGTVNSSNLASFVAVPQNVMLTALRIPQNGISAQTINHQQNNMTAFNRPNVNVSSPTKLNGQFVFPFMQNINGTVVQIPNLMAKMPNFVLPQTSQLTTQRQDHLQNQILINGTLLKLTNTMPPSYTNVNKNSPVTSQSIPVMNKNVPGMPPPGIAVQSKPNYTVTFSHPVLVPQPGFIVTSVPNMNVKETWSYSSTNTASSSQSTCSNPIVHHPPPVLPNFTNQALHTSSIPIAPVKPPDNPIQGTDPPSSTVKEPEADEETKTFNGVVKKINSTVLEPEVNEVTKTLNGVVKKLHEFSSKCDIPWLSKTVNNNIVQLDTNKLTSRPFAQVSRLSEKLEDLGVGKCKEGQITDEFMTEIRSEQTEAELRKVEEVARREETIFTQITVLKDVSSNVQSTLIQANFCTTTESSESGIGTDKSVDSPSDSQTSKECDEDSSLSLSVSVCSVEVQSSQKSPILKQPKTLRFPPKNLTKSDSDRRTSSTDTTSTVTLCQWENCKKEFESDSDLLEHLQADHVETQAGRENYVCLWQQCKVRGKPSCSRLWLERHALSHGGNKPFKCIVDGCGRRFSTQILLERHVNNHFNEVSPNSGGNKKSSDSASKLIRRNGKKLRYRRQPWSARMFDFFDSGIMEGLAWRLSRCTRWRLAGQCPLREAGGRHTLTLHATLKATRYNAARARVEALVAYYPPHVLEDEWVPEKEVTRVKKVEIASLPAASKVSVYAQFCASYSGAAPPPAAPTPPPPRLLPARHCTSSRVLTNLIAKQKRERECSAGSVAAIYRVDEEPKPEVSGAKKRKMGRRYGGNSFWPCGR